MLLSLWILNFIYYDLYRWMLGTIFWYLCNLKSKSTYKYASPGKNSQWHVYKQGRSHTKTLKVNWSKVVLKQMSPWFVNPLLFQNAGNFAVSFGRHPPATIHTFNRLGSGRTELSVVFGRTKRASNINIAFLHKCKKAEEK